MISLWITIGLVIAASLVSTLGAYFSILGLGALFSGALIAISIMAGSLEFAKFVLAAYLHQTWKTINPVFKIYMTFSVITLSLITSIGVFGFLTEAYQSASGVLEGETIRIESLKKNQDMITAELERLNYSVEEIPEERVTKRLQARAAIEPKILDLNKRFAEGEKQLTQSNLNLIDVKKKVGPLIYISRSLNINIDLVVKYLSLIFVSVFDPLAICLVIASTHSIESRRKGHLVVTEKTVAADLPKTEAKTETQVVAKAEQAIEVKEAKADPGVKAEPESDDIIVQMNFKDAVVTENNDGSKVV